MHRMKYAVIGGDLRSVKLANLIQGDGNIVNIYGFKNAGFEVGLTESESIEAAVNNVDVVIGPLPCSNDNETVNAPFHTEKIYINELFKTMSKNQLFVAGRVAEKIGHLAQVYNIYVMDILEREEMAVLNAIPAVFTIVIRKCNLLGTSSLYL